jgi:hypothetical protein
MRGPEAWESGRTGCGQSAYQGEPPAFFSHRPFADGLVHQGFTEITSRAKLDLRIARPKKLLRAVVARLLGRRRNRMVSPLSAKLIPPVNEAVELPVDELAIRLLRLIPTSSTGTTWRS